VLKLLVGMDLPRGNTSVVVDGGLVVRKEVADGVSVTEVSMGTGGVSVGLKDCDCGFDRVVNIDSEGTVVGFAGEYEAPFV